MRLLLKTFEEEVELTVDEQTFSETVEGGQVIRSYPHLIEKDGVFVKNEYGLDEKIQMILVTDEVYLWSAPLEDYDLDVVSDDPSLEPRWVLQ